MARDHRKVIQDLEHNEMYVPLQPYYEEHEREYSIPNDRMKESEWSEWLEFRNGSYWDGTPAPDWVVVRELEGE